MSGSARPPGRAGRRALSALPNVAESLAHIRVLEPSGALPWCVVASVVAAAFTRQFSDEVARLLDQPIVDAAVVLSITTVARSISVFAWSAAAASRRLELAVGLAWRWREALVRVLWGAFTLFGIRLWRWGEELYAPRGSSVYVVELALAVALVAALQQFASWAIRQQELRAGAATQLEVNVSSWTEELLYRSILWRELTPGLGEAGAALTSSVLFGLAHLRNGHPSGPWGALSMMAFGVAACALDHVWGSILPGGLLHAGVLGWIGSERWGAARWRIHHQLGREVRFLVPRRRAVFVTDVAATSLVRVADATPQLERRLELLALRHGKRVLIAPELVGGLLCGKIERDSRAPWLFVGAPLDRNRLPSDEFARAALQLAVAAVERIPLPAGTPGAREKPNDGRPSPAPLRDCNVESA